MYRLLEKSLKIVMASFVISVIAIGLLVLGFIALLNSPNGFAVIPQDCNGIERVIRGQIYDTNGQPVVNATVKVETLGFMENPEQIFVTTVTDNKGVFTIGKASAYACNKFRIIVSADGYETIQLERNADQNIDPNADNISVDNLPDLVIVGELKKLP